MTWNKKTRCQIDGPGRGFSESQQLSNDPQLARQLGIVHFSYCRIKKFRNTYFQGHHIKFKPPGAEAPVITSFFRKPLCLYKRMAFSLPAYTCSQIYSGDSSPQRATTSFNNDVPAPMLWYWGNTYIFCNCICDPVPEKLLP